MKSRLNLKQKTRHDGSRFLSRICRALNLDRNEFVKVLSKIYQRKKECLNGSRICRTNIKQTESTEIQLDGSKKLLRMCQPGTQKSQWIEKLSRFYREETQKSRQIDNLLRCYQEGRKHRKIPQWIENLLRKEKEALIEREAVELEERSFSRRKNTKR